MVSYKNFISFIIILLVSNSIYGQNGLIDYEVEAGTILGKGENAPFWLTANRYGKYATLSRSAFAAAALNYRQELNKGWRINAGVEFAGNTGFDNHFFIHQGFAEASWKKIRLTMGSREQYPFLREDIRLSSGSMVEGFNARPLPQIRIEVSEYVSVPFTKDWLQLKGYFAYGWFLDGNWQRDFVTAEKKFVDKTLYHGKGLLVKVGNPETKCWEVEIGLQMTTQFGGIQYRKLADGNVEELFQMPSSFSEYLNVIFPSKGGEDTPNGDQLNVEGNVLGAWLGAFTYCFDNGSKLRIYAEHYFEDHSQMFMQYGIWKDGFLGVEYTFPKGLWIEKILWEGINTTDQSGPILYEWYDANFENIQISACDDYYNHSFYGAWQYYGQALGHPLLLSPIYSTDESISFRSNRMKAYHLGVCGSFSREWNYTLKGSWTRNWGTYNNPTDDILHQFCGMGSVTYRADWAKGWQATLEVGLDIGKYPDNAVGVMLTIKKKGVIWKK